MRIGTAHEDSIHLQLRNFGRNPSVVLPLPRRFQMKCPKCKSRMYSEKYYDFVRAFDAWRCCACGEVVDPTILANRARNQNLYLG